MLGERIKYVHHPVSISGHSHKGLAYRDTLT